MTRSTTDMQDILCAAIENDFAGGWFRYEVKRNEDGDYLFPFTVREINEDLDVESTHEITVELFSLACSKMIAKMNWLNFESLVDNHDAAIADSIVQIACFGSEVYA